MSDLEGRTLGRYELRRLVGTGGMADVYVGYDSHFNREVAVKIFRREDEHLLRRFVREAHLMASLSNPRLMPVYDAGAVDLNGINIYYIAMPLMKGGTLRARTRNHPLPPAEACRYLRDIAVALDYMHQQGVIHRDIKSSNILLDTDGRCYLSDFGIARASTDVTQMTSTGNIMGTVDYLAPELVETNQRADARSDLYSLGVLLFEMVTGVLPFTGENQIAVVAMHVGRHPPSPRSIVPTVSPAIERVIYKALEKRPELRYGSATELAEAFCHAAAGLSPGEQLDESIWSQATLAVSGEYVQDALHVTQGNGAYLPPRATKPLSVARSTSIYPDEEQPNYPLPIASYSPQQKQRSSAHTRASIVAVMAAVILLTVLIPTVYVLATNYTQSSQNAHALATSQAVQRLTATAQSMVDSLAQATQQAQNGTATAQAGVTGTAQAKAMATKQALNTMATAQAKATSTAQANASATAAVIQTAIAGQPIYSDAFNQPDDAGQSAGWDITDNACSFLSDGYHAMTTADPQVCYQSAQQFQNFAAKVDMELASGLSGGLFFRANTLKAASGYLFEVDSNGQYRLLSLAGGNTVLQNWTTSFALRKGFHAKNTLEVIAQGNDLKLYANGVFLVELQGATLSDEGYLGFLASVDAQNPSADVVYTNLSVYQA